MRLSPAEQGFTLIEVLVALVVSALLIAIVADGAANARTREKAAQQKREAVLIASGLIAEATAAHYSTEPMIGELNGLRYEVSQRIGVADPRGLFALVLIDATIRDAKGHVLFTGGTRRMKVMSLS
jgi:prepilin-type N-terminal cleavage/methylation domain-containing protein